MNQLKGRLKNLETRRDAITVSREHNLGIWVNAAPARQPVLLDIGQGCLPLDVQRALQYPRLTIDRNDRIALEGPNGGGKTMLVRRLIQSMAWSHEHLLYLAQEVSVEESEGILRRIHALPPKELGRIMGTVSRLGSRPERLLESESPSPGEVRKLLIADGIHRNPWLIIMDEPTNHLDLSSIECLESALKECPCALLLVSHDRRFLGSLTTSRWTIENHDRPILQVT